MGTRFWISALLVLPQGGGETTVGTLGDPARWELAGARSFEARSVLGAVLGVGELRAAGRAGSPRSKFLQLVEGSIRSGYQRAGFAQVKVTAAPSADGARLLIQVEEGPQARAGAVRVEGNQQVDDATISGAFAGVWKAGEPAQSDPAALAEAWRLVARCYAEHGFFAARGSVVTVAEAGAANLALEVRVAEEGRASTVTRLEIDGDGDDREAIAARVAFVPGQVWTTRAREELIGRLQALGRYLDVEVDEQRRDAEGRIDPLRVTLTRAPDLPPWDKMPWDDLALLARSVAWLRTRLDAGEPVHVRAEHRGEQVLRGGLSIAPGSVQVSVSAGAVQMTTDCLRWQGRPLGSWSLGLIPQEVRLSGPTGSLTIPFETAKAVTGFLVVGPLPKDRRHDNTFTLVFGFDFNHWLRGTSPFQFEVDVRESALLSWSLRQKKPASGGDTLSLVEESEDVSIQVDVDRATAALRLRAKARHLDWTADLAFPGDPGSRPTTAPSTRALTLDSEPVVGFLLHAIGVDDAASRHLLRVAVPSLLREGGPLRRESPASRPATFEIPGSAAARSQGFTLLGARWFVGELAQEWQLDSWLRSLLTDVAEVCLNEVQEERVAAWEALQRHLRDPRCGPVARWVLAEVLAQLDKPEMAAVFAHSAKAPLDGEAAWRDVLLVAGETELSAIGAAWARDESPELRALFGADAPGKPPMEIARKGFAHLWTKAFERPLLTRLRALDR